MKILLRIGTVFFSILFLYSCNNRNTKKDKEKDASWIKQYQTNLVLGPDSASVQKFIESVKPERAKLVQEIEKEYPGMYNKYIAEGERLKSLKAKDELKTAFAELNKKYAESFKKAFDKSGVETSLKQKTNNWITANIKENEDWDITISDLGNFTIAAYVRSNNKQASQNVPHIRMHRQNEGGGGGGEPLGHRQDALGDPDPSDSIFTLNCPFNVQTMVAGCFAFGGDLSSVGNCDAGVTFDAFIMGGCADKASLGTNLNLPAKFSNVTSTFNCNVDLNASAGALGGGAYSEASVGIKIDEGGIIKVNREEFKISAIAPLIFGVGAILPLRNRNFTASYNKGSFSVITTPSIWVQASGGAGVLAFSHAMSMVSRINSLNINLH